MRIDHHAYQRATGVAASGLFAQLAIALLLLVFGKATESSSLVIASAWAFSGVVVWIGLVAVFYQHRLERLESLEFDSAQGGVAGQGNQIGQTSRLDDQGRLFTADEARVARKRLGIMHSVLMPLLSVVQASMLIGLAWAVIWWFDYEGDTKSDVGNFGVGTLLGWQLAVVFGIALLSFIFSRFLAGMAVQTAWANLRGGAAVMVGNSLVTVALGIGTVIEMLKESGKEATKSDAAMRGIAIGIAIFMIAVAAETLLTFLLNLYRPRRAGETPRPACDSRLLSLLAAPDSIVRSINEAVNYQFGFDITSSWGYQLLLRNVIRLSAVCIFMLLALTTLVVVQPQEQGLRLRLGAIDGSVFQGAPMFKLPWPIDTAEVSAVNLVRELPLGLVKPFSNTDVIVWGEESVEIMQSANIFLVAAGGRAQEVLGADRLAGFSLAPRDEGLSAQATDQFAVVEADIILQYRVRDREFQKYVEFSNDSRARRSPLDMRERALRAIALREVTSALSSRSLEEVLSPPTDAPLVGSLAKAIQAAFDRADCGVEVVGLSIPRLRPPGKDGGKFEELSIARQNGRRQLEDAQSTVNSTMSLLMGDVAKADEVYAGINELMQIESDARAATGDAQSALQLKADTLRARLEQLMLESRGQTASVISNARALRWNALLDAQAVAAEVTGQAAAWNTNPALYRTRRTMDVIAQALSGVRVKYMLLPDPSRVQIDLDLQESTSGLNLGDYLEKKATPE